MIDDLEEEKGAEAEVSEDALEEVLDEAVEEEEVEADLTDEFGNPKEEGTSWE